ncbi:hypothetical protein CDAR_8831 [Caerostris darwini]|uniref:Uncharacterized protein n=1 Tax=Caerostris darwini TaxID=1538125 RepID=A0AAV4R5E6_9ARAC|nr:hypothetical protein CDAR_8831 [Caerostris darwini]
MVLNLIFSTLASSKEAKLASMHKASHINQTVFEFTSGITFGFVGTVTSAFTSTDSRKLSNLTNFINKTYSTTKNNDTTSSPKSEFYRTKDGLQTNPDN